MIKNYLKVALRNLVQNKGNSFINIFGLAIGLASSILIFLFVRHELSYDRFHEKADRVFRVTYEEVGTTAQRHLPTVSPPVGPTLVDDYPEVASYVRLRDPHQAIFSRGDLSFYESDFFYADSAFFEVFTFPLAQGNPETALVAANSVVLTAETAQKYFGDEDPIGQVLTMNREEDLVVTGILEPLPASSQLQFDFLVSFSTFRVPFGYPVTLGSWEWVSFHTYVLLDEGANAQALEAKLPDFMRTYFNPQRADNARLRLQPLRDIYLGDLKHPSIAAGNVAYVYGLSGIAILILLLACFNFMNLATAHSIKRGKEVSLRKVLGARRSNLVRQFLGESILLTLLSLILALLLVEGFTEVLPLLVGWELALMPGDYLIIAPIFLAVAGIVGLLAGSYPALVLSAFQPVKVLKGTVAPARSGRGFRGALVVLQFTIAVTLITASLIVARQMDFIREKELGFDEEHVLALHMLGDELLHRYPIIRDHLLQNPNVISVTKGGDMFDGDQGSVPIRVEGQAEEDARPMNIYGLHYDFVETLGLDVLQGRGPSDAFPSDSADAIMLNQAAADLLAATVPGWEDPIGKQLEVGSISEGQVIGVVKDFHFASLHTEIAPLVLYFPRTAVNTVFLRVAPGTATDLLASLEHDWQQVAPDLPFDYTFLDAHIQNLYEADQKFSRLVSVFSLLTILVACLGLYGLVAFVTQLRTKEVGIRKVLGASVPAVVAMLSKPFMWYVVVANVAAWPLAYFGMQAWLEGFAYRVELGLGVFLLAGFLVLSISLLTVSFQSVKAALADPVRSLRHE